MFGIHGVIIGALVFGVPAFKQIEGRKLPPILDITTDTTLLFGFKDDIVIRITPAGSGSRVDVRSASRVGRSDLGVNAKRIREFLRGLAAGKPG